MIPVHDAGEKWDDSDVKALVQMRAEGFTYDECAAHLGRTKSAVASKLYRLNK